MSRLSMVLGNAPLVGGPRSHASLSDLAVRLFDAVGDWSERAGQRRTLAAASDEVLHDMGLSRGDALAESEKPFWRG